MLRMGVLLFTHLRNKKTLGSTMIKNKLEMKLCRTF